MALVLRRLVPLVLLALFWAPAAYAWSWPVQGPVLQPFSFDPEHPYAAGQHRDVDIGAATGTTVVAPAAGTVTFAGSVPTSGTSLTILTVDGYSVTLTHLGTLAVARGATVAEGETVGTVGPSGTPELDAPYLQLGVRVASDPNGYLDPLTLLPAPTPVAPPSAPEPGAGSSAPPVQSTPPPPAATTPAAPAPVPVPVPVRAASAPSAAEPVRARAAPRADPAAARPAVHASPSAPLRRPGRPAHARSRPHARQAVAVDDGPVLAVDDGAVVAHAAKEAQLATETPAAPKRRPGPVPPSLPREHPASGAAPLPILPLAAGAGIALLAAGLAALTAIVRLRRRSVTPPEAGAIVIPLPQRAAGLEGRRVA